MLPRSILANVVSSASVYFAGCCLFASGKRRTSAGLQSSYVHRLLGDRRVALVHRIAQGVICHGDSVVRAVAELQQCAHGSKRLLKLGYAHPSALFVFKHLH